LHATAVLIRGEWIAIDGSRFRAVASIDSVRERLALQRYLDSIEKADEEQQESIDPSAVQALLMRGLSGVRVEIGLATMAYNLKRITNLLGAAKVTEALHHA
jgi:hypothetical protein